MHPRISLTSAMAFAAAMLASHSAVAADGTVEKVVVKSVAHFDFGTDKMRDADRDALLAEVGKMKDVTWQTVKATGYTDSVGPAVVNQRLSQRRAAAVKSYLVGKGIGSSMIHAQGKAAEDPVASNDDDQGRAQNRRTDVQFEGIRTAAR